VVLPEGPEELPEFHESRLAIMADVAHLAGISGLTNMEKSTMLKVSNYFASSAETQFDERTAVEVSGYMKG